MGRVHTDLALQNDMHRRWLYLRMVLSPGRTPNHRRYWNPNLQFLNWVRITRSRFANYFVRAFTISPFTIDDLRFTYRHIACSHPLIRAPLVVSRA